MTYLNGKHLNIDENYGRFLEVREVKHSAKKADLSLCKGRQYFLLILLCLSTNGKQSERLKLLGLTQWQTFFNLCLPIQKSE